MPFVPGRAFPFVITVDEVPLMDAVAADIIDIAVDLRIDMPGMCTIRMQDHPVAPGSNLAFTYSDAPFPFVMGSFIGVAAIPAHLPDPIPIPMFFGEITAIETEFTKDNAVFLVIRAYHLTHRLHRGRHSMPFLLQPDETIVEQICLEAGVDIVCMPTGEPLEYVLQNNQTDWEFIQERARRINFVVKANPLPPIGEFSFEPRGIPDEAPALLTYQSNLIWFRASVNSSGMVSGVQVLGWNAETAPVPNVGIMDVPPTPVGGDTARTAEDYVLGLKFRPTALNNITDQPPPDEAGALQQAIGEAEKALTNFVTAEGECEGMPDLQPGSPVLLAEVGIKYSGPYELTSVTHTYDQTVGYRTHFRISGSRPDTVTGILASNTPAEGPKRVQGVVIGIVENLNDPLEMGRVQVIFPHLGLEPPIISNWCRIAAPSGGELAGHYFLPEMETEVLVAFEHGDVNRPYILGCLWNEAMRPPMPNEEAAPGGVVNFQVIQNQAGMQVKFMNEPPTVILQDFTGLNSVMVTEEGIVKIMAEASINLMAPEISFTAEGAITMNAVGAVSIKSEATVAIGAPTVELGDELTTANTIMGKGILMITGGVASIALTSAMTIINEGALEIT